MLYITHMTAESIHSKHKKRSLKLTRKTAQMLVKLPLGKRVKQELWLNMQANGAVELKVTHSYEAHLLF